MHRKIRCDEKSKFFCKFFWELNKAVECRGLVDANEIIHDAVRKQQSGVKS